MKQLARLLVQLIFLVMAQHAWARLPPEYGALLVSAPTAEAVRQFDMRPAFEQARASGKPILIYFGAFDCPYCKQLEQSFAQHRQALSARLKKKYFVIEVEGWLRGAKMEFITADGVFSFAAFRKQMGDSAPRFLWPTWYQLDTQLKITRELPAGSNAYLDQASIEDVFEL